MTFRNLIFIKQFFCFYSIIPNNFKFVSFTIQSVRISVFNSTLFDIFLVIRIIRSGRPGPRSAGRCWSPSGRGSGPRSRPSRSCARYSRRDAGQPRARGGCRCCRFPARSESPAGRFRTRRRRRRR